MKRTPCLLALSLLSAALLTACSDDDSPAAAGTGGGTTSPVTSTVTATPSLGKVSNADLAVTCAATGAEMGTATLTTTGSIAITATGTCSGPVLVTLTANATTVYYDEASATDVSMPDGTVMRALLPALTGDTTIAITPLTEIAAAQAIAAAGSLGLVDSADVTAANADVLVELFGSGVTFDILVPPTLWDASTTAGSLGTTDADRYAFYLAALAELGSGSATPALATMEALADDLADGALDGATTTHVTYTDGDFATKLDTALDAFYAFATAELQTELGLSDGGGGEPSATVFGRNRTAADVSTFLSGFSGTGTLQSGGAACTFSYADGTLSVSDGTNTLTATFDGGDDDILGAVGNELEFRAQTGTASHSTGVQMPGSTRIQLLMNTPYTGSPAYPLYQVRGRLYASDYSNTYVYCNTTGKSFDFTAQKDPGSLDFLATDSTDWVTLDSNMTTAMATSGTNTTGAQYNRVVSYSSVESANNAACSLGLAADGNLTVSVTNDTIGTKSTTVNLVGKTLYTNISLLLRRNPLVALAEPAKGYVIYTQSLGDTQNYVSWADTAFYEGPIEIQARVQSSPGNFETFYCRVRN